MSTMSLARRRDAIDRVQVATLDEGRGCDASRTYDIHRVNSRKETSIYGKP